MIGNTKIKIGKYEEREIKENKDYVIKGEAHNYKWEAQGETKSRKERNKMGTRKNKCNN